MKSITLTFTRAFSTYSLFPPPRWKQNHSSVLVSGTCQIPDPVYKLVGSIVCFYIPLLVMLITYYLTVRLLARQRQNLGGNQQQSNGGWASGWLGQAPTNGTWMVLMRFRFYRQCEKITKKNVFNHFIFFFFFSERGCTWRRLLKSSLLSTPSHAHSATSTDTELSNLDMHELWLPDSRSVCKLNNHRNLKRNSFTHTQHSGGTNTINDDGFA